MNKIIINGREVPAEIGDSLKEILEKNGFVFTCGGKGICGKCRLYLPAHPPTQKDKLFLTKERLDRGYRLACDKRVEGNEIISFEEKDVKESRKLTDAVAAADITESGIAIGIFENGESVEEGSTAFSEPPDRRAVKSGVDAACVGFYEKYGVAKAKILVISGDNALTELILGKDISDEGEFYPAEKFNLPAESIFIPPHIKGKVNALTVAELADMPVPSVRIKTDKDGYVAFIKEDEIKYIPLGDYDGTPFCEALVKASLRYLLRGERIPVIYAYGKYAEATEDLTAGEFTCAAEEDKDYLPTLASSCINNRLRAKLYRTRNKITYTEVFGDDEFQILLNSAAADGRHN